VLHGEASVARRDLGFVLNTVPSEREILKNLKRHGAARPVKAACSVLYKQADAESLQRECGDGFGPLLMDITDADAVHQAAQKVGCMIGDRNLVGLVNNAGIVVSGQLLYLRPSEYRRQLDVNMISPLVVIQAFAPLLGTDKKRRGPTGCIVNISSTTAKVVIPLLGAYSSSKCGLEGMSLIAPEHCG
jgi:NAD(P)-dependent dehydrogenase (short-subunit alcohol dehydrogenase family)